MRGGGACAILNTRRALPIEIPLQNNRVSESDCLKVAENEPQIHAHGGPTQRVSDHEFYSGQEIDSHHCGIRTPPARKEYGGISDILRFLLRHQLFQIFLTISDLSRKKVLRRPHFV